MDVSIGSRESVTRAQGNITSTNLCGMDRCDGDPRRPHHTSSPRSVVSCRLFAVYIVYPATRVACSPLPPLPPVHHAVPHCCIAWHRISSCRVAGVILFSLVTPCLSVVCVFRCLVLPLLWVFAPRFVWFIHVDVHDRSEGRWKGPYRTSGNSSMVAR